MLAAFNKAAEVDQPDLVAFLVVTLSELVLIYLAKHLPNIHVLNFNETVNQIHVVHDIVDQVSDHLVQVEFKHSFALLLLDKELVLGVAVIARGRILDQLDFPKHVVAFV